MMSGCESGIRVISVVPQSHPRPPDGPVDYTVIHGTPACTPSNAKYLYNFVQRRPNVEDVAPALYKCYTNVLCLLGHDPDKSRGDISAEGLSCLDRVRIRTTLPVHRPDPTEGWLNAGPKRTRLANNLLNVTRQRGHPCCPMPTVQFLGFLSGTYPQAKVFVQVPPPQEVVYSAGR